MRICLFMLLASLLNLPVYGQSNDADYWLDISEEELSKSRNSRWIVPDKYRTLQLDFSNYSKLLMQATNSNNGRNNAIHIKIPFPDLTNQTFEIVESPLMEKTLADAFPQIKTFRGKGLKNPNDRLFLDVTPQGVHAMVLSSKGTVFIDPYFKNNQEIYLSYYKKDFSYKEKTPWSCGLKEETVNHLTQDKIEIKNSPLSTGSARRATVRMRTYRLAVAATQEYTSFHGGTQALGQAAIVTAINRVSGIYEDELGIKFILVAKNQDLVYTNNDPYSNNNGNAMLGQNQNNIDSKIGSSNYDVGHVFSTGGGGIAGLGVICNNGRKAEGVTGLGQPTGDPFYVDFVAHELGHQFGGNHTFNGNTGNCFGGSRNGPTGYEPGSGSTIQAYAGICGSQNLQSNTDPYFHLASLNEMTQHVTNGSGANCPVISGTNNQPVANANHENINGKSIPISTPFELTGSATDADNDKLTYNWEQWDLGSAGNFNADTKTGPIFRSFAPTSSPTRIFPKLSDILNNTTTYGEVLPRVGRTLNFQFIARDDNAIGAYHADAIQLTVVEGIGPFKMTNMNSGGTFSGSQNITWQVAGTNANGINCANVDIYLSRDGGQTFTELLADDTPNDGSATVTLPEINITTARIKIKSSQNVFFDINDANFTITPAGNNTCAISNLAAGNATACDPATNTYAQQVIVTYTDAPNSGNLVVNGQNFAISSSPQTVNLTNLPANGQAVNVTAHFSDNLNCKLTSNALFTAPASCKPVCSISNIEFLSRTDCNPSNDRYTANIRITYANPPQNATLRVNGQNFQATTSPQDIILTNLMADGQSVNITAQFAQEPSCSRTAANLFTAPNACMPVCAISKIEAGTQTACVSSSNTYTQAVIVTYENAPSNGELIVNNQRFPIQSSPQTVVLTNLVANGQMVNTSAAFSANLACSTSVNNLFTAPNSCAPICAISGVDIGNQSACDSASNTYSQEVIIAYTNPPNMGNLVVNGQHFPIQTSPQTVKLINLPANGRKVNVAVNFSSNFNCAMKVDSLFTAPTSCVPTCLISDITAGNKTDCDSGTNTFTQELQITYANPPNRGHLKVNGQRFPITGSPQTVILKNLPANGSDFNVTAFFSRASNCKLTKDSLFKAPEPCGGTCVITALEAGKQSACDSTFNDYSQEVIVTYQNAPSSGRLYVAGQGFPITGSPQTVNLTFLEANGENVDVTAWFSRASDCFFTQTNLFTAPNPCIPVCKITDVSVGVQSNCDPNSNTYSQELTISYDNAPYDGRLVVNGQRFFITGSPQTVYLDFLKADSAYVDVEVHFTRQNNCRFSREKLFQAPPPCQRVCAITDLKTGTQSACNAADNTYTQEVIVTYENAPSGGKLVVNGQRFDITSSPQTVLLTKLKADSMLVEGKASFTWDFECEKRVADLFRAPPTCQSPCAITDLAAGKQDDCNPFTNTFTQEIIVTYENAPAFGFLIVNRQWFPITGSPQAIILEGIESDGKNHDVVARFAENPACTKTVGALFTAPSSCAARCEITGVSISNQTTCDSTNNEYTQELTISYNNPPPYGKLIINGQRFNIQSSPQTVVLEKLNADGMPVPIHASFSSEPSCTFTQTNMFTAPSPCQASCSITAITANVQGDCNSNDNTFTQEVIITYENEPTNGKLVVNGQRFDIQSSPQTVILNKLQSDGQAVDVTAFFTKSRNCTFTVENLFTAPANCAPICVISDLKTGNQSACDSTKNSYSQELIITYENAPSRGFLIVNGELFPITTSPQTVQLTNLEADGKPVDVSAHFSGNDFCFLTKESLFTAPNPCIPICSITNLALGSLGTCITSDNTFTQDIILTYENAPRRGKLVVNNQRFPITGSPQTVTLTKLQASGNEVDVNAYFTHDPSCVFVSPNLIKTPEPCLNTVCGAIESSDTPLTISSTGRPLIASAINVSVTGKVTDVNIKNIKGKHTWISDLVFTLTSPTGTSVTLVAHACDDEDDFNIGFDDEAPADALPCPLTDGIIYRPKQLLSKFIGEDPLGDWTLKIKDHFKDDGGSLDSWVLEICTNQANGSCNTSNLEVNRDSIYNGDYISNNRIKSRGKIKEGAEVMFKSINSINLEPGFSTTMGAKFTAMIDNCQNANRVPEDLNGILYQTDYVSNKNKTNQKSQMNLGIERIPDKDQLAIFPNPFRNAATIEYAIQRSTFVNIRVVDSNGQVVSDLLRNQYQDQGVYQIELSAASFSGGLYLLQIETENSFLSKKFILIR